MATRREIQFTIDDNGEVSIKVLGVKGDECERITREIELALGVVSERRHTSEYYQQTDTGVTVGSDRADGENT
ncbi:MAG: DUF2997 domain-containing protein [Myxococcales bacterium]|nr:DUF2997 domain-containing protein [Myxococcales bacterium]